MLVFAELGRCRRRAGHVATRPRRVFERDRRERPGPLRRHERSSACAEPPTVVKIRPKPERRRETARQGKDKEGPSEPRQGKKRIDVPAPSLLGNLLVLRD